jgi:glycerol-3-phosphate dehydrogenase (NAD(P)+)
MGNFAVLGATSWGTTLASLLHRAGNTVTIITRTAEEAEALNASRGLPRLPEVTFPESVRFVPPPIPAGLDGVVLGVPAQSMRRTIEASGLSRDVPVLSAAKGIEHATGMLMSELLADLGWPGSNIAAVSGPNLAREIARGLPATAVVASTAQPVAGMWQQALAGATFRVYTSTDLVGVEFAGAYKNVIAIASGAAWGLQFGANTVSSIMTRGLAEMGRLGAALGADPMTFLGLAGVGDLSATCFSPLSRNRRFGELLAQGQDVATARKSIGEAIEGAATAPVALQLAAKYGVELPLCAEVAAVVAGEKSVPAAMAGLLSRPLRTEAGSGA